MRLNQSGLYVVANTVTGGFYIGSTADFGARFRRHKHGLRRGGHGNRDLQRAWDAHGESAFRFEPLTTEPVSDARDREQRMLDRLFGHPLCYNRAPDAFVSFRGIAPTPETRAKMSASRRRRGPISDETRAKMSAGQKGKAISDEHKAKLSAAHTGKTLSPEHRAKLSASHMGKAQSPETRAKRSASLRAFHDAKADGHTERRQRQR